jgi:hypothetical protein
VSAAAAEVTGVVAVVGVDVAGADAAVFLDDAGGGHQDRLRF